MKNTFLMAVASMTIGLCAAFPASASANTSYPEQTVRVVVPFPPGSATDMAARLISEQLQKELGGTFMVENRPGAGGSIGALNVVRAEPDGHTLLFASNSAAASNAALYKSLPYDPTVDFTPIAGTGVNTLVLMVRDDFPANTLEEFIEYVQDNPGKLNAGYGSSSSQVCVAMLSKLADLDVVSVPYKGIPHAVNDVLGGSLDFTFVDVGNAIAQASSGRMRPLAVASADRNNLIQDVQPVSDIVPGYDITAWFAFLGPAGMSPDVVDTLYQAIEVALQDDMVIERLATAGITSRAMTPDQLGPFIAAEVDKWKMLVKEANIEPI